MASWSVPPAICFINLFLFSLSFFYPCFFSVFWDLLKSDHFHIDVSEIPELLSREEVELWASPLDSFLLDGRADILKMSNTPHKSMLPRETLEKLQNWIRVTSSAFLWVQGPVSVSMEQQLSLAAIRIRDLVLNAGIPCIAFSPKSRYDFQQTNPSSGVPKRETILTALLYSMVGQLVRLLPPEFVPIGKITQRVFEDLDGSVESLPVALDLIALLLGHTPPTLVVIIDKLHLADSPATRPYLIKFVELFRDLGSRQMLKVLFTTAGSCAVLAKMIKKAEKVDAARMVQGRPGQHLRGWSSLGDLRVPRGS